MRRLAVEVGKQALSELEFVSWPTTPIQISSTGCSDARGPLTVMIDTARVQDRRRIRFETVEDALADVDRIVAAEAAGTLRTCGNWTAGQAFGHVAGWINYAYEGFPLKTPWFIRIFLRMKLKKMLRDGMPAGVRIPRVPNGTCATDAMSTQDGAQRLRQALHRLACDEPTKYDSTAFGPMPNEQRVALNLRHAELHLSFLHP